MSTVLAVYIHLLIGQLRHQIDIDIVCYIRRVDGWTGMVVTKIVDLIECSNEMVDGPIREVNKRRDLSDRDVVTDGY